jgi:hypothetical protein
MFVLAVLASAAILIAEDFPYRQPSKIVADALNAAPTPSDSATEFRR